ncbi:MAG TPA: DUF2336 domain-containing protein [Xanthobacteraceae bacterium]|nr:DUF2336 domain-containing protein [Xanthobacteraceae bacterium]
MDTNQSLIWELEAAIKSGSRDKRVATLRRITDLFVADADRLNERQIQVFDNLLAHLVKRIEGKALEELSQRLAPINNAPVETVQHLARHDNIAIAVPILTQSARLTDNDLIEIASTKTQAHLLAISGRSRLGANVTDAILQRGDGPVYHRLAENLGASFSDNGLERLTAHSERDERLAEKFALRLDVPSHFFRKLMAHATETVRSHLLAVAGPESRTRIQHVLAQISENAHHQAGLYSEQDCAEAYAKALELRGKGQLSEATLLDAVKTERGADTVAILSVLCGAPLSLVQTLLRNDQHEAFITPCKAAGLGWQTVHAMLASRSIGRRIADHELGLARADYAKLSQASAQRVLRFWQVRHTAAKDTAAPGGSQEPASYDIARSLIAASTAAG